MHVYSDFLIIWPRAEYWLFKKTFLYYYVWGERKDGRVTFKNVCWGSVCDITAKVAGQEHSRLKQPLKLRSVIKKRRMSLFAVIELKVISLCRRVRIWLSLIMNGLVRASELMTLCWFSSRASATEWRIKSRFKKPFFAHKTKACVPSNIGFIASTQSHLAFTHGNAK